MKNDECPVPEVIRISGECLDVNKFLRADQNTQKDIKYNLSNLVKLSGQSSSMVDKILKEYDIFKDRLIDIVKNENNKYNKKFSHILFVEHLCSSLCGMPCNEKGKPASPIHVLPMKFLHLFKKKTFSVFYF